MVNNMELADLLGGQMRYKNDPPTTVDMLNEIRINQALHEEMIGELLGFIKKLFKRQEDLVDWINSLDIDIEELNMLHFDVDNDGEFIKPLM